LSPPEADCVSLRHRGGETSFAEQWHAQVTAVVELLIADRKLDPEEWSQALGAELDRLTAEGAPDTDDTYYTAFLGVLENTLDKKRIAHASEVDRREIDWREAYLSTPHGRPVILRD
jgi:hypothetical protein